MKSNGSYSLSYRVLTLFLAFVLLFTSFDFTGITTAMSEGASAVVETVSEPANVPATAPAQNAGSANNQESEVASAPNSENSSSNPAAPVNSDANAATEDSQEPAVSDETAAGEETSEATVTPEVTEAPEFKEPVHTYEFYLGNDFEHPVAVYEKTNGQKIGYPSTEHVPVREGYIVNWYTDMEHTDYFDNFLEPIVVTSNRTFKFYGRYERVAPKNETVETVEPSVTPEAGEEQQDESGETSDEEEEPAQPTVEPAEGEAEEAAPQHNYHFFLGNAEEAFAVVSVKDGEELAAPAVTAEEGKTFLGWFTALEGGELFNGFGAVSVNENQDINLYALFADVENEEATHTYFFFVGDNLSPVEKVTVKNGEVLNAPEPGFALEENFEFKGWYTEKKGGEKFEGFGQPVVVEQTQVINLYARIGLIPGTSFRMVTPGVEPGVHYHTYKFTVDGAVQSAFTQVIGNQQKLSMPETPSKAGHKFLGWFTQPAGGNEFTSFNTPLTVTDTKDVNLYARFQQVYYVFFYDNNNKVVYTAEGANGASIPTSAGNGYVNLTATQKLDGWYRNSGLTQSAGTSVTINGANINLYAKVVEGFWLTYETDGGTVMAPAFYSAGQNTVQPAAPTKQGYTFGGWFRNEQTTTPFTFGSPLTNSISIYAKWTPAQANYELIYWLENPNDDGYTYEKTVVKTGTTGAAITLDASDYNVNQIDAAYREFFTYKDHENNKTIAADGSTKVAIRYTRNEYTFTFDLTNVSGKTMNIGGTVYTSGSNNRYSITAKYDQVIADIWPTASHFNEGSGFSGWKPPNTNVIWASKRYNVTPDMARNAGTVVAQYQTRYDLDLRYMVESLDQTTNSGELPNRVRKFNLWLDSHPSYQQKHNSNSISWYAKELLGFTKLQDTGESVAMDNPATNRYYIYFYYSRNSYALDFNNRGAVNRQMVKYEASIADKYYVPQRPASVPSDYVFEGWYTTATFLPGTKYVFEGKKMPPNSLILYANWVPPIVNVKIHKTVEGTANPSVDSFTVPYGTAIPAQRFTTAETALVVPPNNSFVGWYFNANAVRNPFNKQTKLTADIELFPNIINNAQFKLTYHANGGTGTLVDDTNYAQGSHANVLAPTGITAPNNKVFTYWTVAQNGSGTKYYPGSKILITGNMTLYANYADKPVLTSLTYNYNHPGNSQTSVVNNIVNNDLVTVATFGSLSWSAPSGHTFLGWNTAANGSGAFYDAGNQVRVNTNGANVLYAQWAKPVTVTTIGGSFVYDGQLKRARVEFSNLSDGYTAGGISTAQATNFTPTPIVATATNVRIRNAANVDVTNRIQINYVNGTLEVTKRPVTLTSASATKVYDGQPLTNSTVTPSGDGFVTGQGATYNVTGTQTAVGESNNTFTYTLNTGTQATNYNITKVEGKLKVTPITGGLVVTIKGKTLSEKYNGTQRTVSGYDVVSITLNGQPTTLFTASNIALAQGASATATGKDAGSYPMGLTSASFVSTNPNFGTVQFNVTDGGITIAKRNLTLTSATASKVYDGQPLTAQTVTPGGDNFVSGEGASYTVTGTQTVVGTSKNTYTYTFNSNTKASNYNVTKVEGDLTVNALSSGIVVTLKGKTGSKLYNGQAQTLEGYDVVSITLNGQPTTLYKAADFGLKPGVQAKATGTNAGSYTMGLTGASFQNNNTNFSGITFNVTDGKLDINKRNVTLTSATASKVYDGQPLTAKTVTPSGDGFVAGQGATYNVTGTQTTVGTSKNTYTYTLNSGTLAANYNITKVEGDLTVTTANAGITVVLKGKTNTALYDGTEKSVSGYDVVSISNPLYTAADFGLKSGVSGEIKKTDAGTYNIGLTSASFENKNSNFSNITFQVSDGTLTINKRQVTLTSGSAEKVYDGQALTNGTVTPSGDGFVTGQGASYNVTGTQTAVGESPNTFTYTLNPNTKAGNYTISVVPGLLKVTQVAGGIVVTLKGKTGSQKYTGAEQVISGYDVVSITQNGVATNLYKASDFGLKPGVLAQAKGTNAGSYNMGLTGASFQNNNANFSGITFNVTDGKLDITKRDVTLTSATASKVYDGTPLTNSTVTPSGDGFVAGQGASYNVTGTQTAVGTSKNTFSFTLNGNTSAANYNITKVEGDLTVNALASGIVVTLKGKTSTGKYNGQDQSVEGYEVASITLNGQPTTLYKASDLGLKPGVQAKATGRNAGTYNMGLTGNSFQNNNTNFSGITFNVTDGKIDITKRDVTLTSGSASKTYDGNPLIKYDVTVGGDNFVGTEGATYTYQGTQTNAGSSQNAFEYALKSNTLANNYNITKALGTLTVNKLSGVVVNIKGNTKEVTFDGNEHVVEGYVATASTPLYNPSTDVAFSGTARAARTYFGQTNMNLLPTMYRNTNDNFENVTFNVTDGYVKINAINTVTVNVKGNKGSFVYNGTEHTVTGYTLTASNPLYNVNQNVQFSGNATVKRTDAGKTAMGLKASDFKNTNSNYESVIFVIEDGEIEVTPLTGVTVNINGNKGSFMYDGQPHTVTGYTATSSTPLFVPARDIQFSGTATATRTEAGVTKMNLTPAQYANKNPNFKDVTFVIDDGQVSITQNDKLVVTLKGNTASNKYTGAEQVVTGYTVESIKLNGQDTALFTANQIALAPGKKAEAKGTDFGTYNMGLTSDSFVNNNPNFTNVTLNITDGKLDVTKRSVTITSASAEKMFDGVPLTKHVATPSGDNFVAGQGADYSFTGSQTQVGSSPNSFTYTLKAGTKAINYDIQKVEGTLTVTEFGNVKVSIVGNTKTVTYNGQEHVVTGYVATATTPLYNVNTDIVFNGNAEARRTDAGQTNMNLAASMFSNRNQNFNNVEFIITDGFIKVNPLGTIKVKLAGKNASGTYDGTAQSVQGYDVVEITAGGTPTTLFQASDIGFAPGKEAKATGTDAGTYRMNLTPATFVSTNPNFTNVVFEVSDGALTLNKREISLTSASESKVYDGTPLTNSTVTPGLEGFVAGQGASYTVTGTQTLVGTSKNFFSYTLNPNTKASNYNITKVEGDLTVTQPVAGDIVVKLKGNTGNKKYNGAEQSISGYEVAEILLNGQPTTLLKASDIKLAPGKTAIAKGTDFGTYTMGLTPDHFIHTNPNFGAITFDITDGKLDVDKRDLTITSASAEKVYDGIPLTKHDAIVSGDGFVAGQGADYTFTGTQTEVGSSPNTFNYTLKPGTNASNYNVTTANGTLEVTEMGNIKVRIVGNTKVVTYDGNEHTVTGYVATANTPLFDVANDIAFNGTAEARRTDVGQTNMNLTAAMFSNRNQNFNNVEFIVVDGFVKINPLGGIRVKLEGKKETRMFDATLQTLEGFDVVSITANGVPTTALQESDIALAPGVQAKASGLNAGRYRMGLASTSFVNTNPNFTGVTFEVTDGELTLSKRNVTFTSASDTKPYDGTPLTNHTVTVSGDGFPAGQGATYNVLGTRTLVGTSRNNFTVALNPGTVGTNYNFTKVEGELTITPAQAGAVVVKIAGKNLTTKYNGAQQSVGGYTVTEITLNGQPTTLLRPGEIALANGVEAIARGKNAGTYDMGLTAASFVSINPNFGAPTFDVTDGKLVIEKRNVNITSVDASKPYDGTPLTRPAANITGDGFVVREGVEYNFTGSQTTVGDSPNAFTYTLKSNTDANNYNITKAEGTLTVTPREKVRVYITGNKETVMYDGQPHTVTTYTAVSNTPLFNVNTDLVFTGTPSVTRTDAGKNEFGLTPAQFSSNNPNVGDVEFIVTDGFLQINKRPITLTSASDTKPYDGTPLTNHNVSVGGEGVVPGEAINFNVTGSQTAAGASDNEFTYTAGPGTNLDNYNIKVVKGRLTVTGVSVIVDIVGNHATHVYDGTAKTVTGYTATSNNPAFDVNTMIVFTGTDTATRTNAGITNMGLKSTQFRSNDPSMIVGFRVVDGFVEITPITGVTVNITGNNTIATYNGQPHTASGYTLNADNPLLPLSSIVYNGRPSVSRTNAGTSMMNLDSNRFKSNDPNFKDINFVVTDGFVTVNRANVTVNITGNSKDVEYNGNPHTVDGFTFTSDNPSFGGGNIVPTRPITVTGIDAGDYHMGLTPNDFTNTNPNYDVTFNIPDDGLLRIRPANVTVTIQGNGEVVDFDGNEHVVSGYTAHSNNPGYDPAANITFSGVAEVRRTLPGTDFMNLTPSMFTNTSTSPNIANVTVVVKDGYLTIRKATVIVTIVGQQRTFPYDGYKHYASGYEAFASISDFDVERDVLFTGDASVSRTEVGISYMGLKPSQFVSLDPFYNVVFRVTDGSVEIVPSEFTETVFNVVGNITLAGKLEDRDKPGSFESLVRNNWLYPFESLGKVISRDVLIPGTDQVDPTKNVVTVANITTFFTNGVPTQDNITTPDMIQVLKEAGIDMVTVPAASDNLVSPEIYRESAAILRAAGISNNAYEGDNSIYIGNDKYMGVFSIYANEFTPDIAAKITDMKANAREVVVAEVHFDEAAYRAEVEGQNLSAAAIDKHVRERKQAMARAIIDAGGTVVLGYGTDDVEDYEEYNGGYIFYGLGKMLSAGNLEPGAKGTWDSAIIKLKVMAKPGEMYIAGFTAIPMSLSSSADKNDFKPFVYEKGSEGYWRIMKKLNGTWE